MILIKHLCLLFIVSESKIKLRSRKHVTFKCMQFHKKMLSNLTNVLTSSLTKYVLKDGFKDSYDLRIL